MKGFHIKSSKDIKGFTLIELLAVLGVFALLTVATVTMYPSSASRLKVSNIASDLQGDIRQSQLDASSVSSQQQTVAGYGINFPLANKNTYQLFADKVTSTEINGIFIGNQKYDGQSENSRLVVLPDGYSVTDICVNSSAFSKPFVTCRSNASVTDVTLLFKRPSSLPIIYINNSTTNTYAAVCAQLEYITSSKGRGFVRNVILTKTGLIQTGLGGCLDGQTAPVLPPPVVTSTIDVSAHGADLVDIVTNGAGFVYTASFSNNNLIEINTLTATSSVYGNIGYSPEGIVSDGSGTIYVLAKNGGSGIFVKFVATAGAPIITISSAPAGTVLSDKSMALDSLGYIFVIDDSTNKVWKIDPVTSIPTQFATTQSSPKAIALDSSNNVYVLNTNTVSKFDAVTGVPLWNIAVGPNPTSLDIDSLGNVYTSNSGDDSVTKITQSGLATLAFGVTATGGGSADIVVDSVNSIFTANRNTNNVSKITQSGAPSILAPTGNSPSYITVSGTTIYVANKVANTITKIVQ
jgi:prepilin-type N-terminal cleavage/methylation domain-containing protein